MTRKLLPFWTPLTFLLVMSAAWLVASAWPASFWFDARKVHFSDIVVGTSPAMTLDRTIKRPFDGAWTVAIRRWDGGWVSHCNAAGSQPYKTDSKLPKAPDLKWWTWGQCHPLTVGRYEVTTVWNLNLPWPLPDKRVELVSNVFEVRE